MYRLFCDLCGGEIEKGQEHSRVEVEREEGVDGELDYNFDSKIINLEMHKECADKWIEQAMAQLVYRVDQE